MITGCAAPTGLPGHDQRVRSTSTAAHERQGQGHGDPGATAPDHRPRTPTGPDPAAVLSRRPRVPRGAATPGRHTSSAPITGAPRNSPALAQGSARPPPRSQISSQASRPTTNHPLDPNPGAAPGTRESRRGFEPAHISAKQNGHLIARRSKPVRWRVGQSRRRRTGCRRRRTAAGNTSSLMGCLAGWLAQFRSARHSLGIVTTSRHPEALSVSGQHTSPGGVRLATDGFVSHGLTLVQRSSASSPVRGDPIWR